MTSHGFRQGFDEEEAQWELPACCAHAQCGQTLEMMVTMRVSSCEYVCA